jgi:hypothetical protein
MIRSRRSLLVVAAAMLLAVLTIAPTAACPPEEVSADDASVVHSGPIVLEPEPGSVVHGLPTDSQAVGPGISVKEALVSPLDGPLLVNGVLVRMADGSIRLVDGIDALDRPSSLLVEGLDASAYDWSQTDAVEATGNVQVLGTVEDGTLVVSVTSI